MKAMILAAGFGTRLWPLTEDRTKPAIPFLNRPLISYSVEYLAAHGIRDVIVNLHHQPDSIRNALGDGSGLGVRIHYSHEDAILGTAGALDRVRDLLSADDFVVINGKIVTTIDLNAVMQTHLRSGAIATLVLKPNTAQERFSIVETASDGRITRFAGFPDPDANYASPPLLFTGIQALSPRIFDYVPRNRFSHTTTDVFPQAMAAGEIVMGHVTSEDWYEMSTLSRYLEASLLFVAKQGLPAVMGAGCQIDSTASVAESVLWNDVVIEANAAVRHAVIGDRVRIPAGSQIERAVVVRREIVSEIERGEVVGDNLLVPLRRFST